MAPDVLCTDASSEVPFLRPAAERQEPVDNGNPGPDTNDPVEMESSASQMLYEDVAAQIAAAREFTTLVAAQILDSAGEILDAAAHLGPQRVVMLLA
jgi:hypothetical protein